VKSPTNPGNEAEAAGLMDAYLDTAAGYQEGWRNAPWSSVVNAA
jgi:hypothetical protein